MSFSFFHTPEHRNFNYKPRYYDPERDTKTPEGEFDKNKFARNLHDSWNRNRPSTKNRERSGNRKTMLWAILILALLLYIILK